MKVMFYEAFEEEKKAIRKFLPSNICAQFTGKTIQEENEGHPPAELISIRTQSRIPLAWAKSLKGILTRSRGYDHLLTFRRQSGINIVLGCLDDYCARAAAEQAVLMMMALLRKLKKQIKSFTAFSRDGLTGRECRGKNALVVGVGHIGREIVDIANGLRMNVKGVDIVTILKDLEYVSLAEGIKEADVVFCALPLTKETEGLLNYEVFSKAKRGMIFINIARGEISPAKDLKKLFDEGILSGVGLDVYPQEDELARQFRSAAEMSTSFGRAILELSREDHVLFTPHNAFNTVEALEQKALLSVAAITSFLERGIFPCPVPSE